MRRFPSHWAIAHEGDRVVPILEITDDMLAQIDLRDGTTDEWPDLLGEPTLKTIDFEMDDFSYDPYQLYVVPVRTGRTTYGLKASTLRTF